MAYMVENSSFNFFPDINLGKAVQGVSNTANKFHGKAVILAGEKCPPANMQETGEYGDLNILTARSPNEW